MFWTSESPVTKKKRPSVWANRNKNMARKFYDENAVDYGKTNTLNLTYPIMGLSDLRPYLYLHNPLERFTMILGENSILYHGTDFFSSEEKINFESPSENVLSGRYETMMRKIAAQESIVNENPIFVCNRIDAFRYGEFGIVVHYKCKKALKLLDMSDVSVVNYISESTDFDADLKKRFIILLRKKKNSRYIETFVERDSTYAEDSELILHLCKYLRENAFDGYFYCCEGLHEEIMLCNASDTIKYHDHDKTTFAKNMFGRAENMIETLFSMSRL